MKTFSIIVCLIMSFSFGVLIGVISIDTFRKHISCKPPTIYKHNIVMQYENGYHIMYPDSVINDTVYLTIKNQ